MRPLLFCSLLLAVAGCQSASSLEGEAPFSPPESSTAATASSLTAVERAALDASLGAANAPVNPYASYRQLSWYNDTSTVFVSPAVVGPKDTPWLVGSVGYRESGHCGREAQVRYTADGWTTFGTVKAPLVPNGDKDFFVVPLPAYKADTQVEAAALIRTCRNGLWVESFWISNGGANFRYRVVPEGGLTFLGNGAAWVGGIAINRVGGTVQGGHDLTVTVESYPEVPGAKFDLHYQLADGTPRSVPMSFDGVGKGDTGHNVGYQAAIPTSRLLAGSSVTYWVSARDAQGNTLWDSRDGQNYHASVVAPAQVAWAGSGIFTYIKNARGSSYCDTRMFTRDDNNWCYRAGLVNPFKASHSNYQPYASFPYLALEVYVPGVSDRAMDDGTAAAVGAQFLKVEFVSDLTSITPAGAWSGLPMKYATRKGNNFIYAFMPVCTGASSTFCGVGALPNGMYEFKFRVSADNGASWVWVGSEDLPAGGENRVLDWNFGRN